MNAQSTLNHAGISSSLVGRDAQLSAFKDRFENRTWGTLLVTGPAGIGKTTLVRAFESIARGYGWRVLSETPVKGLAQRMRGTYLPALYETLAGETVPCFDNLTLGEQMSLVAQGLNTLGEGLLITIDHPGKSAAHHLRELIAGVLSAQGQGLPVQLVLAGRGADVRDLLGAAENLSLGEKEQIDLRHLSRTETEAALLHAYRSCSAADGEENDISPDLLTRATRATYGYPYMVHLVGDCIRRSAQTQQLTDEQLTRELADAQEKLGNVVLAPLLAQLSEGDRAFISAMAEDEGPSKMSAIANRLGKTPQYVGVYRNRLVEAQIIKSASYGKVTFVIPHLRDYLRTQNNEENFENF